LKNTDVEARRQNTIENKINGCSNNGKIEKEEEFYGKKKYKIFKIE